MSADFVWMSDRLKGEYKEVFSKAEVYAGVHNIGGDAYDEMMMDLLDLLLTAQEEEKPVEKVVGSDIENFCGSYFSTYTMKNHLLEVPRCVYRMMWFVFVFELIIYMLAEGEYDIFQSVTDVTGYLLGIAGAWTVELICRVLIRPFIFRWKWLTSGVYYFIVILLTAIIVFLGLWLFEDQIFELPVFWVLVISGGYIVLYLIVRSIRRYRHHGSIRKKRDPVETEGIRGFFRQINQEVREELPEELCKRFEKKNQKLKRRGKQPMTPEEYMELLKRENIQTRRWDKIGAAVVVLVVLGFVVQVAVTSEWMDTIIFIPLLLIFEIPAILIFRVGFKTTGYREQLVEECEQRGITILEYAKGETKDEIYDSTGSGND